MTNSGPTTNAPAPKQETSSPTHPPVVTNAPAAEEKKAWPATTPISVTDLREFDSQPPEVQRLIAECLRLTSMNLEYDYGSADPKNGGMDCSGFVHYVVGRQGYQKVPRQANHLYLWVRMKSRFHSVLSSNPRTPELDDLRPGDLLFWTGTYDIKRDPPVTHAMIYLGRLKSDGRRVMAGASEGRRYGGKAMEGVTVFDFELPRPGRGDGRFVGYGSIPGLIRKAKPPVAAEEKKAESSKPASTSPQGVTGSKGTKPQGT